MTDASNWHRVLGMEINENSVDFTKLISQEIGKAIADKADQINPDVVLDAQGVADMLTTDPLMPITPRIVVQMVGQRGLPGRKLNGRHGWRFTRNSVIEWIKHGPETE